MSGLLSQLPGEEQVRTSLEVFMTERRLPPLAAAWGKAQAALFTPRSLSLRVCLRGYSYSSPPSPSAHCPIKGGKGLAISRQGREVWFITQPVKLAPKIQKCLLVPPPWKAEECSLTLHSDTINDPPQTVQWLPRATIGPQAVSV